jgi:mannitol-1-phosphate/altronate dehydrogenase
MLPILLFATFHVVSCVLMRVEGEELYKDVSSIASSNEKFIAFDIHYLRFINSCQFLSASLDTLVQNIRKSGEDKFIHTSRHMKSDKHFYEK